MDRFVGSCTWSMKQTSDNGALSHEVERFKANLKMHIDRVNFNIFSYILHFCSS